MAPSPLQGRRGKRGPADGIGRDEGRRARGAGRPGRPIGSASPVLTPDFDDPADIAGAQVPVDGSSAAG